MSQPTNPDLKALHATQAEATALIALLLSGIQLSSPTSSGNQISTSSPSTPFRATTSPPTKPTHNPLGVLSTAATLVRSQSTHLGLLALTPPFTPTALSTTLRTITKLLPAFAAALEDARSPRLPQVLAAQLHTRVRNLLDSVRAFVAAVPADSAAQKQLESEDEGGGRGARRVLRGTGVVWAGCDWFVDVGARGSGWWASEALRGWEGLAADAVEEVGEWMEGADSGNEGAGSDFDSEDEDIFGASSAACPPDLRPTAERALAHLKHLRKLYPALRHAVLDGFPSVTKATRVEALPSVEESARLDKALSLGEDASREADEVAAALYAGQEKEVRLEVQRVRAELGKRAGEVLGESNEWVKKWEKLAMEVTGG